MQSRLTELPLTGSSGIEQPEPKGRNGPRILAATAVLAEGTPAAIAQEEASREVAVVPVVAAVEEGENRSSGPSVKNCSQACRGDVRATDAVAKD